MSLANADAAEVSAAGGSVPASVEQGSQTERLAQVEVISSPAADTIVSHPVPDNTFSDDGVLLEDELTVAEAIEARKTHQT